jgi:exodeoxyribonuclease VII small subunit
MTVKKSEDISKLSFEQALSELEEIVSELESGEAGLDKAMEFYLRGQNLKEHCSKRLAAAKLQVEKISAENGGNPSLLPFTPDA